MLLCAKSVALQIGRHGESLANVHSGRNILPVDFLAFQGRGEQLAFDLTRIEREAMKTVLLLRHAKSSWDHPQLTDHQRPLAPRGIKAAPRIGRFIAESDLIPDRVICSSARRAMETWELVEEVIRGPQTVEVRTDLYHASTGAVVDMIQNLPDEEHRVLLVGHNPTFEDLALHLSGDGDPDAREAVRRKYPTGALAVLDFQVDSWSQVWPGKGFLTAFVKPKTLSR